MVQAHPHTQAHGRWRSGSRALPCGVGMGSPLAPTRGSEPHRLGRAPAAPGAGVGWGEGNRWPGTILGGHVRSQPGGPSLRGQSPEACEDGKGRSQGPGRPETQPTGAWIPTAVAPDPVSTTCLCPNTGPARRPGTAPGASDPGSPQGRTYTQGTEINPQSPTHSTATHQPPHNCRLLLGSPTVSRDARLSSRGRPARPEPSPRPGPPRSR